MKKHALDDSNLEQIRRVFCDNFSCFSTKTYVVGTH